MISATPCTRSPTTRTASSASLSPPLLDVHKHTLTSSTRAHRLWDLRNVRTTLSDRDLKKQHLNGLARSKVVQTMFRGRGELDLLEMAHFSRLSIRG